jgi:predicted ATPase
MLGDKRFLRTIRPRNILSFGPTVSEIELLSLNVLIGPNGSGKSNLIEVISLLQAAPRNLFEPIQTGGGITEWLWKGADDPIADIDVTVSFWDGVMPLRHRFEFALIGQRPELVAEVIEDENLWKIQPKVDSYYTNLKRSRPIITGAGGAARTLGRAELALDQSILAQRKDPVQFPQITYLGNEYGRIRLFREWQLGRRTPARRPQPSDLIGDFLSEDAANLALVLNDLEHHSTLWTSLIERLKQADESIEKVTTKIVGGTIQVFLHYSGLRNPVPATRLSDGTVRYLCLLAVLYHPSPPPLVCLEEPELGLHPDLLPGLADLLIEASHRMQLIVTTHSDALVDGLTKVPEAVIVCEKRQGSTAMTKHPGAELSEWLKDYGLGQLWRRGDIGGNRW